MKQMRTKQPIGRLRLDRSPLGLAGLAAGGTLAVIGFLYLSGRFGHGWQLSIRWDDW